MQIDVQKEKGDKGAIGEDLQQLTLNEKSNDKNKTRTDNDNGGEIQRIIRKIDKPKKEKLEERMKGPEPYYMNPALYTNSSTMKAPERKPQLKASDTVSRMVTKV